MYSRVSQLPCTLLRSWLLRYRTEVFHTTQETLCKLTGTYIDSSWSKAWRLVSIRWLAISGVLTHTHAHTHPHTHTYPNTHTHTEWGCARGSSLTFWWRLGTNMTLGKSQTMIDQVGGASPLPSIQTYMHYLPLSHTTAVFPQNQLYVVFAAENSGMQLGSYVVSHSNHLLRQPISPPLWVPPPLPSSHSNCYNSFSPLQYHSFEEAISILTQVAATVAVGEAVSASYCTCSL